MIEIRKDVLEKIVDHAKLDLPNEACGYLAGNENTISISYQLTNIEHSPEHFSFDPEEQFKTLKDARAKGLQILANYHSHPKTPARPSKEDIRLAYDPEILYFIISLAGDIPVVRAFRINEGSVSNESLIVTDIP